MPEEKEETKVIGYRPLTEEQKRLMNKAKELGNQLGEFIENLNCSTEFYADGRCLAIARTEIQTGLMWLNRAIAQPETFC
uniref:Acb2/Tad1 domain-containing protein n=1 Tax=Candidatus Scatocola faecipullorum TaxID=2840917 RepID=UPI0040267287